MDRSSLWFPGILDTVERSLVVDSLGLLDARIRAVEIRDFRSMVVLVRMIRSYRLLAGSWLSAFYMLALDLAYTLEINPRIPGRHC